jgi:predicted transcriptional regulator of viral defense system
MIKNDSEAKLFRVAAAQGGNFTARQARLAGFSDSNHGFHLRSGNWIREWRGIYRLARYPLREDAQYSLWGVWASDRQGKPLGAYSHETALSLFGLSDIQPARLHMTVPRGYRRHGKIPEVLCLHHADVEAKECEERNGYRVIRPFRTFIDLVRGRSVSPEFFRQAVRQALDRGYLTRPQYRKLEQMPRVGRRFREMAGGES